MKKKKSYLFYATVCVCLSVFFLADATHLLGTPGPAGAGPRHLPSNGPKAQRRGAGNLDIPKRSCQGLSPSEKVNAVDLIRKEIF